MLDTTALPRTLERLPLQSAMPATARRRDAPYAALVVSLYLLIAVFHLASAAVGYSHYRDQHLGTALEYAKSSINLFRPVIVGFNATATPTPQELPIWHALAGAVFKALGLWFGWANLLSLVLFAGGLWPLFDLAKTHLGARHAWWTLVFFLSQPIVVLLSGQASADGLSFALSVWFLFFADRLVRTERAIWLAPAVVFGALSAVTKLPLFMCVGLTSVFLQLVQKTRSARSWLLLGVTGAVCSVTFFAWTRYTDSVVATAEFPLVDLRLSYGSSMWIWYFGDWSFRLSPFVWAKGGWAALNSLFGSFALLALAAAALFFSSNRLGQCWFAAAMCVTLVFTHLVLIHRHYFMLFSPAVAMLCASAIVNIEDRLQLQQAWQRSAWVIGTAIVLVFSAVQGLKGIEVVLDYDPYPKRIAALLREQTGPLDKLVVQGAGGEILMLSQRNGLLINNMRVLDDRRNRARLHALGYTKLVMISESPLLNALQQIDPPNLSRERLSYRQELTPAAEQLTTIFESPDILIKDLAGSP